MLIYVLPAPLWTVCSVGSARFRHTNNTPSFTSASLFIAEILDDALPRGLPARALRQHVLAVTWSPVRDAVARCEGWRREGRPRDPDRGGSQHGGA